MHPRLWLWLHPIRRSSPEHPAPLPLLGSGLDAVLVGPDSLPASERDAAKARRWRYRKALCCHVIRGEPAGKAWLRRRMRRGAAVLASLRNRWVSQLHPF